MSVGTDDLGVLGDLAEAIGLTADGAFSPDWLSDPGGHLSKMLARQRQRDALIAFVDEVLGGSRRSSGPDGSVWLPIAEAHGPDVTVYLVVDDRDAASVAIGLGVKVHATTPQASLAVHLPLFRAAKEGHTIASPLLLGTAAGRATLELDITFDASAPVPGLARLGGLALDLQVPTGAGGPPPVFGLTLRGLQLPGAPSPRDLSLSVADLASLEDSVLELVLGLARAQAAALGSGPLAALAGLIGLRDGIAVPPLPLHELAAHGVTALAQWLGSVLQGTTARTAWLGQLALLLGAGAQVEGEHVTVPLGPLRLTFAVPATPGAAGLVRVRPTVGIEWPAQAGIWLAGEAVLCSLDLGDGSAAALPSLVLQLIVGEAAGGSVLIDVSTPTALHVGSLRAGFGLDAQRRPTLLLAADNVHIASHSHGTLDLSSPDAIAAVGATLVDDITDEVLDRLGPAADAVRVLLGLTAPAGHPEVVPLTLVGFLQNPLEAVRGHWLGLVQNHPSAIPSVLAELRGLVADAALAGSAIEGLGTAVRPWELRLAGPVVLQVWREGSRLRFGPAVGFIVDDIGQRCTRLETGLTLTLVDIDLAAPSALFLGAAELAVALRARGRPEAVIDAGPLKLSADRVVLTARWTPAGGLGVALQAPNLAVDVGGGRLPVPLPVLDVNGRITLDAAGWSALEQLLSGLADAAAPPWVGDLVGMLGWRRDERRSGVLTARLSLAALAADPAAALREWVRDMLQGDHEAIRRVLDALSTLLTGARNGVRGLLPGSGTPDDPWRLVLGRASASAELVAWIGPDGPASLLRTAVAPFAGWVPGLSGLSGTDLALLLAQHAPLVNDIAALLSGRDELGVGFDALVSRWAGTDGRVPPPASAAGITLHRLADVTAPELLSRIELDGLLGAVPTTIVHVAVSGPNSLPFAEVVPDRVIDLTAPGLQASAFTPPAGTPGSWFVALGGRDACRNAGGDEDGVQGQADRLARVLAPFAALPGTLVIVADAAAGHAARRAAEAVIGVDVLVTAGTPLDAVSLQVLDTPAAGDALRLLARLLPAASNADDEHDEADGDNPDLYLGRGLVSSLMAVAYSDDPARELRPPSVAPGTPRAGLVVHMLFGELGEASVRRAISAIVVAGLARRLALRRGSGRAAPNSLVVGLRARLDGGAPALGAVTLAGRVDVVLANLKINGSSVTLETARELRVQLEAGRRGAWLLGGPDPGRTPGQPQLHQLRRVDLDLVLPLSGSAAAQASLTLHDARVFDIDRERWRLQAGNAVAMVPGYDAATTLLPEARVLLGSMASALAAELSGPGAVLRELLGAIGAVDALGGSVPDAIEHLLNDPRQALATVATQATSRERLVAALRGLFPQLPDAAPGEVTVAAGPLSARVRFAPWRIEVTAGAAAGAGGFGWFDWQAGLAFDANGIALGHASLGTAGATVAGGLRIELNQALRLALQWSRPGAASPDEIELWPALQSARLEAALVRLVPAEITRLALEGLRSVDESARPIVDAALGVVGLLGAPDAQARRAVLLPAALFADPVAWLKSEAALGAGQVFAPAKLVALIDAFKPLLGVPGPAGTWQIVPGIAVRADADAAGAARLALAIDSSAFASPGGARLNLGGAFALSLRPGAAPHAGVEIYAGLPAAATGRSALHVTLSDQLRLFLRPAVGADIPLFPNPAGLGQLAQSVVTQALPLVLDALAELQPQGGVKGQVGTLVQRLGDAMALRSAGHFQASALQAWAQDPAAALVARLPALVASALDQLAQAISPLLPGGASASFTAGAIQVTAGGFTLSVQPAPLAIAISGTLNGLPAIDHAHLALAFDTGGLKSLALEVGPAQINAGSVMLRPAFSVVAGAAPMGGARASLGLGLPGNRLVGARWLIGNRFDLVLVNAGVETTDLGQVALGLIETALDMVASFVLSQAAVQQLLGKTVGTATIREVLKGALLKNQPTDALIDQPFALNLLLGRLQTLAANVAAANPSITIDNALTIGLAGTDLGGGAKSIGVRVSLPRRATLVSGEVTLALEAESSWIHSTSGPVPDGIVIELLRVGPGVGVFALTPGISVNGVGLRISRDGRPLLEAGSFSVGSVALHVFAKFNATEKAGGAQIQLSDLAAGVAAAGGGNGVAQGLLGDSGSGPNRLAPAFSPALSVQKHGSGPVLVGLRAGDGTGPWWLAIQRGFGPLYIEQVGFGVTIQSDQLRSLSVLLDGRVSLLGLTAAVDDLQLTFVVASDASVFDASRWAVDLAGLAFNAELGGLTLQGGLRKFGSGDNVQYVGMLMGRFAVYGLSVFGGYGQGTVGGERFASFFAFGAVNGPIGGPPAFFLTGIGGGLGINRQLVLPTDFSHFDQFPLIKALDPAARPSDDPMAELIRLGDTFPMQRGSFWFAAGVSFTSFALVDGIGVLSVQVGDGVEVALLGLARMALPRPQVAIVSIELGLVARFSSKEGVLWVQAQLTDNSWLLYPDVRLTGGFAFVIWFAGPNRGQFVLTIGGYHPSFRRAGYPEVPRLGLNWRVGPFITIKGESYFALTSEAVMAGVRIEVSATFGPAWAQVIFGADGIVYFDPFHFQVEAYASIRAGITIDVWIGEITISISISARIMVEGPSFHGIATFSVGPVDLAVEFGDANQAPRPLLPWDGFVAKYLEEAQPGVARALAAVAGRGALPPGAGPGGATDTATADGSAAKPFEVYAEFEITLTNAVPTRRVELGNSRVLAQIPSHSIGLAPMGLSDVTTVLHVDLADDLTHQPHIDVVRAEVRSSPAFPLGVWGPVPDGGNKKIPSGDVLEAIDALRLFTVANIPPGLPPIDYRKRVEVGNRHPLPFVAEHATRSTLLASAAALKAMVPAITDDDAVFATAAQWAVRGGASRTAVASLKGERAAPPRLGSLADGLALDLAGAPAIGLVEPARRGAVNTHVQRPKVLAVMSTGLDEPERAVQRTTVAKPPAGIRVQVSPPSVAEVVDLTSAAVPAVLHRDGATRGATQNKTFVAADSAALTRIARAPLAAVRGRGATREVRDRLAALNGSLLNKPGTRAKIMPGSTLTAGEVAVMALPNAARDLDEKLPRPSLAVAGADARIVALRHGGEVIADVELPAGASRLFAVPQGTERLAVAVGVPATQQRPGFAGWHSGSALPSLGFGCALAAQAVVQVEGRVRTPRVQGLKRESGWIRAADLVEGTAIVATRFALPVTVLIVALDEPAGSDAGRGLTLALDGAKRAVDVLGEDLAPVAVVRGQRTLLVYEVVPDRGGAVTVSVASEDGWHLVGVMAAAPGADPQAVAAQLALRGLDLLVRGAVAAGTQQATLAWQPPTTARAREIPEPHTRPTPRRVTRARSVSPRRRNPKE